MAANLMSDNPLILLAEDRQDDVVLLQMALAKIAFPHTLEIVNDGEEAIAYLKGQGRYADHARYPLPTLLLLDLKMPRQTGFEVLEWLRATRELKGLRTIVLTSSADSKDVSRSYELGANAFFEKPLHFGQLVTLMKTIQEHWLGPCLAPQISRPTPVSDRGR